MDLKLISGDCSENCLAKSERYLLKYFPEEHQIAFIVYYDEFQPVYNRSPKRFYQSYVEHTGFYRKRRMMQLWVDKLKRLRSSMKKAHEQFDFEMIEKINSGNVTLSELQL